MTKALEIPSYSEWNLFTRQKRPLMIAGPCSAETEEQLFKTASLLKNNGIEVLRAGIWKPRTRPNCFEGVGVKGLPWLQNIQRELGMKISTEVANAHHVETALKYGMDMLWIGARSTANPFAVQEIADSLKGVDIPVLVKNPVNPDIELWIGAFERLYLCGITKLGAIHRGFSSYNSTRYRNMPQWQIPIELKRRIKNLPLFCDPSHISGHREYIQEISQKAMDLGFDGLIIESHVNPDCALSDASQQITPDQLNQILTHLVIREEHPNNSNNTLIMEELREKIDTLDNTIMEALTNRMKIIEEIGMYKKQNNITILQPDRWEKILTRVLEEARKNNLSEELVERVFKAIHQASIDRQTDIMNE
ncbi:MAG: bifunctional 3-deoxy-7-phosphoheptulonate synthase/chorismate mutase type II [Sanguibacteroides justesenii]|jgi:putative 3-deoxy-7-phosphoheptulonate synthase|uniref:chorismate mutase n=1 Tax=Butyricimonas faecalis TaxID=2093856 RepID=UPI001D259D21|nr:bifunctional 3-deoxy-7-phosphoheptulonate synthase/chorismate mutase type II [Sanguibacteroides justesenii]